MARRRGLARIRRGLAKIRRGLTRIRREGRAGGTTHNSARQGSTRIRQARPGYGRLDQDTAGSPFTVPLAGLDRVRHSHWKVRVCSIALSLLLRTVRKDTSFLRFFLFFPNNTNNPTTETIHQIPYGPDIGNQHDRSTQSQVQHTSQTTKGITRITFHQRIGFHRPNAKYACASCCCGIFT